MDNLEKEIADRIAQGNAPMTLSAIKEELRAIGYCLDRTMDCRSNAKWMTGDRAGETYPCITTGIKESDSGLSFANGNARRDDNFRKLQDMRFSGKYYAVVNNAIFEI